MSTVAERAALVGRDAQVEALTNAVLAPDLRGVLVLGREGIGKTALAEHVVARLGDLVRTYHVHGSPVLSRMDYGVLSPYLESAAAADIESPLAVLRTIRRYFRRQAETSGAQALLVIDDAHYLDEASCHVITQLAMSGDLRLLVLSRFRVPQIQELLSLARDGMISRVDLQALDPAAVHIICQDVLGGPVLRAASALLFEASGGNPLYLKALITQSRRQGILVESNGAWYLRKEPEALDASVVDLIKGALADLGPAERACLETAALAGPLPRSVLAAVTDGSALESLLAGGLLFSVGADAEQRIMARPLHAEVIRSLVPAVRSAECRRGVLARRGGPRTAAERVRDALWALDCGETVPDSELVSAAQAANAQGAPKQAERLAAAVQEEPHLVAARVETAAAYVDTVNFAQARVLLDGIVPAAGHPLLTLEQSTLTRAANVSAKLLHRTNGGAPEYEALAAAWLEAAARLAAHAGGPEEAPPGVQAGARLLRVSGRVAAGDYAGARKLLAALVAELDSVGAAAGKENVLFARGLYAEVLCALGEVGAAAEHSSFALELLAADDGRLHAYCSFLLVRHAQILLQAGRFGELERLLEENVGSTRHHLLTFGGTLGVFQGAVEIHQGRLREGLQRLHPAVEALRVSDPELLLPYALGMTGYAASVIGESAGTARYAAELDTVGYTGPHHLWLVGTAYAAAAAAAGSDTPAETAPRGLTDAADEARRLGLRTAEKDILELCLAVGDLSRASRLAELAAGLEGGAAQALHAYAAAVASGNPERMVSAADEAVRHRKYLVAVESIGHAIRHYGNHGNLRRQRALIQQLRRRREEMAGVTVSYLSPSLHLVRLTRREHEIVHLLLDGASSRDIASHFTLSQRTVEGHIYRIYVKLGISRRADLESAYRALEPGPKPAAR